LGGLSFRVVSTQPAPPDPAEPVETPFADAASPFKRTKVGEVPVFGPPPPQPARASIQSSWVTYRSQINFGFAMLAYLMVLVGAIIAVQANPGAPWRYYVAVLPAVPAAIGLVVFVRALMRLDEVQTRIQLYALGLAVGAVALVTFGYAFFEGAGLPHMPPAYVLPLMGIFWGVGTAYFSWRYRS
jgi:hypothetical protein